MSLMGARGGLLGACGVAAAASFLSDSFTGANGTHISTHDANWLRASAGTWVRIYNNGAAASDWANSSYVYQGSNGNFCKIVVPAGVSLLWVTPLIRGRAATTGYVPGYSINFQDSGTWHSWAVDNVEISGGDITYTNNTSIERTIVITASGTSSVVLTLYINGTQISQYTHTSGTLESGLSGFGVSGGANNDFAFIDYWADGE